MKNRIYLSREEVDALLAAAQTSNCGTRDYCLLLLTFRHGMRISEVLGLTFLDLDMKTHRLHVRRLYNGLSTIHPMGEDEVFALNRWIVERAYWKGALDTDRVFLSRRGNGLSRQQAYRIVREAGEKAGMTTEINPQMLRHACGFGLAEQGVGTSLIQDFLGHRNIRHTKKYTESDDSPFIGLWQDVGGFCDDKTKGCNESVDGEEPCEKGNSWGQTDT